MGLMVAQGDFVDFLNNPEGVQEIDGLVDDIRYALMDYQVCACKKIVFIVSDTYFRLQYNGISIMSTASLL